MSTPSGEPGAAARPLWLIDRDLDAVAAHLDPWILAAERDPRRPHHINPAARHARVGGRGRGHAQRGRRPVRDRLPRRREPVVITARLAVEIAADRTAYLVALRQASHALSEGMFPRRWLRHSP